MENITKIGFKNNSIFLIELMDGNTLGGYTNSIFYNVIMKFNDEQLEILKSIIHKLGYDVEKSLVKTNNNNNGIEVDFSCYVTK